MAISLLNEAWIPIRESGDVSVRIAPWQIADGDGLRYVALAAPRADFNGALAQFLIGLLQTAFAPEDDKAWRKLWDSPPTSEQLKEAFDPLSDAFMLDGDGPRFMQDLTLQDAEKKSIASLLIDAPGEKTERENKDHFIKRDAVAAVCVHCAATALFCLQINAPSGGQGNRVGLRGGGPITTLLVPRGQPAGLWHFLWLNVLPKDRLRTDGDEREKIFPWLGKTLTSVNDERVAPGDQANPLQMYWGMPRRIRLQILNVERRCDICGQVKQQSISDYVARNFGVSYVGWEHVLSPHSRKSADTLPIPLHGQAGGIGFRHWTGIVVSDIEGRKGGSRKPALIVSHHRNSFYRRSINATIWAFGYNMVDNMKARAWADSRMPVLLVGADGQESFEARQEAFETLSKGYVSAASEAFDCLRQMAKAAFYGSPVSGGKYRWSYPPHVPTDGTFYDTLSNDYWRRGEQCFFEHLEMTLGCTHVAQEQAVAESWLHALGQSVLQCFEAVVKSIESGDRRVKAVIFARNELAGMMRGDSLRALLGLHQREMKTGKPRKGTQRV